MKYTRRNIHLVSDYFFFGVNGTYTGYGHARARARLVPSFFFDIYIFLNLCIKSENLHIMILY